MGLIKAVTNAAGSVLKDQFKELFSADSLGNDVLMVKGKSNTPQKGSDNIITKGSGILVNEGQCAIIVDQAEIIDVCAEAGYYVYDNSTEPTIFCGSLKQGIKESWDKFKTRVTYGGGTGHDQRVYFFNTKEMMDNKFGTPTPIPFRVVDSRVGLDVDVSLRCSGTYSFRIADPVLFYKAVAGNIKSQYTVDDFGMQLKTEFMQALQPAIGKLSEMEIRPSAVPAHVMELTDYMNSYLSKQWGEKRGMEVVTIALNPVTLTEEDQALIKEMQTLTNPNMAAARITAAQAEAMKTAAGNSAGAMNGFMGVNMAMGAGGMNAANLFQMGQQQAPQQAAPQQAAPAGGWTCSCGAQNTGNFCTNCGAKKPEQAAAKFCPNCGAKLENPGKFCPECGQPL